MVLNNSYSLQHSSFRGSLWEADIGKKNVEKSNFRSINITYVT